MSDHARRLRVTDLDHGTWLDVEPPGQGVPTGPVTDAPMSALPDPSGVLRFEVVMDGWRFRFEVEDAWRAQLRDRAGRAGAGFGPTTPQTVRAQIPGRVVSVDVTPGERVALGQRLLSIEAMKMENEVRASRAGTVEAVLVTAGARVDLGADLVRIV